MLCSEADSLQRQKLLSPCLQAKHWTSGRYSSVFSDNPLPLYSRSDGSCSSTICCSAKGVFSDRSPVRASFTTLRHIEKSFELGDWLDRQNCYLLQGCMRCRCSLWIVLAVRKMTQRNLTRILSRFWNSLCLALLEMCLSGSGLALCPTPLATFS